MLVVSIHLLNMGDELTFFAKTLTALCQNIPFDVSLGLESSMTK